MGDRFEIGLYHWACGPVGAVVAAGFEPARVESVDVRVAVAGRRAGEVEPAVEPASACGVVGTELAGCAVDLSCAADAAAKTGFGGVDGVEPGVVPRFGGRSAERRTRNAERGIVEGRGRVGGEGGFDGCGELFGGAGAEDFGEGIGGSWWPVVGGRGAIGERRAVVCGRGQTGGRELGSVK